MDQFLRSKEILKIEFIEEKNKFRFHRLKRFAENWITQNLNSYSENFSFIKSITGPQDYLDFLSLILLGHHQQMEDYFLIKDINLKIEKLITFLPQQGPLPQGKIIHFPNISEGNDLPTRHDH